jgi:hypothetical protein
MSICPRSHTPCNTCITPAFADANANTYIAVTADMGTIVPLGWEVAEAMGEEHTLSGHPFDMVIVAGDLSYATVDPPNNEVSTVACIPCPSHALLGCYDCAGGMDMGRLWGSE